MGVLQNSINSMLGTAAVAARLSPGLEKKRELLNLENKSDVYKKQIGTQTKALHETVPEDAPEEAKKDLQKSKERAFEGRQDSYEKLIETQKQAFDIDPSMERYQKLEKTIEVANKFAEDRAKAKAAQTESMKKRRNFMEYLKNEPTSLGVKVGDLPTKTQKSIAKQFDYKQRKNIMDIADKQKEGK